MSKDEKLLKILLSIKNDKYKEYYLCNRLGKLLELEKEKEINRLCYMNQDERHKLISLKYPEFKEWILDVGQQLYNKSEIFKNNRYKWKSSWLLPWNDKTRQTILLNKIKELKKKLGK